MKTPTLLLTCATFVVVANARIDFESGTASHNQFSTNFRLVRNPTYIDQTDPADAQEPNNDHLFGRKTPENATSSSVTAVYDTTPGDPDDEAQTFSGAFKVNLDISTSAYNGGVGIYLIDARNPADHGRNLFARFYFRDSATPSGRNTAENRIIISKNAGLANGSGGARYTTATGLSGTGGYWHVASESYRAATVVVPSPELEPTWHNITLTYTPGDNDDTTLEIGSGTSFTATVVLSNADRIENPSLGFYINHPGTTPGGTTKIDNFTVTMLSEPADDEPDPLARVGEESSPTPLRASSGIASLPGVFHRVSPLAQSR